MESASASVPAGAEPGGKGLKSNAIGYLTNLVISIASVAPAYSLAATLGFIVAIDGMGVHAPAVMIVSFIPMLLIASAYNYMNRADPDCGTSFTWVTRAMGPRLGLDHRLGHRRRGRRRDGDARLHRRQVHLPAVQLGQRRATRCSRSASWPRSGSA